MTIEITNDQQAQKWQVWEKLTTDLYKDERPTDGLYGELIKTRAALAAYEQRKAMQVELSDDARIMLRYCELDHDDNEPRWVNARNMLKTHDLINNRNDLTPQGRAYLAALDAKPKRELKWEVWNKTTNSLRCSCDDIRIAEIICRWHNDHVNVFTYEVREVK